MHLHPTRLFVHILVGRFFSSHSTFRLQIDCSSMMLYELPLILWKCLVMSRSHLNHPKEIWFCDFSLHLLNNFRLQMNEANRNRPHETKERGPRGLKDAYNAYIYIYPEISIFEIEKTNITLALALKSLMSKVLTLSHRCKQMHILGGWFFCFSSKNWVTCFQTKLFRTSEQLPIISGGNTSNY